MHDVILSVNELKKSYAEKTVVNGISFDIKRGEVFGLLGPNGAGKTTTISMISGLIIPDVGRIQVDGLDFSEQANAIKAKLGLVPQELALYPTLSARDNLLFFGRIYGIRGKMLRERVDSVLDIVKLADRAKDAIQTYSGGMKRRINIAAGLLHQPDVLFLDEPTVGVDPQSRNAIFESLEDLKRQGLTILYTTHYMEEAQRLCDRVAIIDQGEIIALDTPRNLIQSLGGGMIRLGLNNGHLDTVQRRGKLVSAIKNISRRDDYLLVETHKAQDALMGLLEITNQLDARVTSLEVLEPNLETVFLQMTGKSLRE
ncbi:MAG: ABC transporter ATP-binding protein [Anaerolineaceae bacterium]|nr:ABC transporter ATP-binding protein [Anaerolineaceae bacterium]